MKRDQANGELERLLGELPELRASAGFTDEVLARLDGPATRRRPRLQSPVLAWTLAGAALFGALLLLTAMPPGGRSTAGEAARADLSPERQRAARLREEHRRLRDDIRALRTLVDENPPVVLLGGDDRVDLVLDFLPTEEIAAGRGLPVLAGSSGDDRR